MKIIKTGKKTKTIKSCSECPLLATGKDRCFAWGMATVSKLAETLEMEEYKHLKGTKEPLVNHVILKECHLEEVER